MRQNILIIIAISLLASCASPNEYPDYVYENKDIHIVDLDKAEKMERFPYSKIFEKIQVIKLDNTDAVIGQISKLLVSDGRLFIMDKITTKSLWSFDMAGNCIKRFGNIGRGKGEYTGLSDFTIDETNGIVYLFDNIMQSILAYNAVSGEFINGVHINKDNEAESYSIQYSDGCIYTDLYYEAYSPDNYLLQKVDLATGQTIGYYFPVKEYARSFFNESLVDSDVFGSGNKTMQVFVKPYMDIVAGLEGGTPKPCLYMHSKEFISRKDVNTLANKEPSEIFRELTSLNKIYSMGDYIERKEYVYFSYRQGAYLKHVVYNKKDGKAVIVNPFDDLLFKVNDSRWLPKFGCHSSKGIYQFIDSDILLVAQEDAQKGLLSLDGDDMAILKSINTDYNPIVLFYQYTE